MKYKIIIFNYNSRAIGPEVIIVNENDSYIFKYVDKSNFIHSRNIKKLIDQHWENGTWIFKNDWSGLAIYDVDSLEDFWEEF